MKAFIHGFFLAIGLILPLGVQNLFIFTQGAIQKRFSAMLPIVISAGISDTMLILLAVQGVSMLVLKIAWFKGLLVFTGVIFLSYIGWLTWKSNTESSLHENNAAGWTLKKKVVFTLSVSILNPHAILDTIGVIGTSSLAYTGNDKMIFTAACIMVSWLWFSFLAIAGRFIGNFKVIKQLLNKISAVIMWLSAVYLVKSLLM